MVHLQIVSLGHVWFVYHDQCIQQTWFPVVHIVMLGTYLIYLYRVEVPPLKVCSLPVYLFLGFLWAHSRDFPLWCLGWVYHPSLPWGTCQSSQFHEMNRFDCPPKTQSIPMIWLLWILMCLLELLVITMLKTPELVIVSSTVTSPSYVSQCEYRSLCLNEGSNTQLLPMYGFSFPLGILHLIYPLE